MKKNALKSILPYLIPVYLMLNSCTMQTTEERTTADVEPLEVLPLSYDLTRVSDHWGKCTSDTSAFCARINLSYPVFEGEHPVVSAINHKIMAMIMTDVLYDSISYDSIPAFTQAFLDQYKDQQKEFPDSFGWMYTVEGNVGRNDSAVVAIQITRDLYTGGAHGMYQVIYKNIDPQNGSTLELDDLFTNGYKQALNTAAKKAFMQAKGFTTEEEVRENGYNFENDQYYNDNFLVLNDRLKFYFNGYDIAAFAAGPSEFTVSFASLSSYLRPWLTDKAL